MTTPTQVQTGNNTLKDTKHLLSQTLAIWLIQMSLIAAPAIDAYMLAKLSTNDVAAMALGGSFYFMVLLTCKGVLQGLCYAVAEVMGAQNLTKAYRLLIQSGWLMLLMTVIAWAALAVSVLIIGNIDISPELKAAATSYTIIIALGVPASLAIRVFGAFYQGISKPIVITFWLWIGLTIKVLINYALLAGWAGSQWQNVNATAVSTVFMHWFVVTCVLLTVGTTLKKHLFNSPSPTSYTPNLTDIKKLLSYGVPIGISYFVEVSVGPALVSMIAVASEDMLAAHQILLTVSDLLFSIPIAFMIASSVMVGQHIKNYRTQTRRFSKKCEWGMVIFMIIGSLGLWMFGNAWVTNYTDNTLLIAMMLPVLFIMGFKNSIEGVQSLMAFNLRAIDKGWYVVVINTICLWSIAVGGVWTVTQCTELTLAWVWGLLGVAYLIAWLLLRMSFFKLTSKQNVLIPHLQV